MHRTLATLLVLALPSALPAQTVDLVFEPPVLSSAPICDRNLSDEALVAKWEGADPSQPPETDTAVIKRDLRRLIELDPVRWFDLVAAVQGNLRQFDPAYSQANMLIDRIELLLSAGRLSELQQENLVEKLAALDLTQTPRAQHLLAGYLMRGVGIDRNVEQGEQLLLTAAFGGNADAILDLVEREIAGRPMPGWDVPPELGVTMAFGALLGKLDPLICDRVNRIAREYMNGRIVTRDPVLAERWYRFSADLGDALSAWRVAEIHLRAEDLPKDNDTLLHYLTAASDAGLPYAQAALARLQADGALMPRDLAAADETYRAAAASGWAPGAASHVLFLQAQSRRDPDWTPRYVEALSDLVASPQAPAWALIAMADHILTDKGRWAGEAEARDLLDRAIALGEDAAMERTAAMRFRAAKTPAEFYSVMDQLIQVVVSAGEVDPLLELSNAYICRAPDAPRVAEADYWVRAADSTATHAVDYGPADLQILAANPDPILEAEIQTQALTGRVTAIAQYMHLLTLRGAPAETLEFWHGYATRFPGVTTARASLALKAARSPQDRAAALDLFREAVAMGELSAQAQLAEALLDEGHTTPATQAEALELLLPLADRGMGEAMELLPLADPDQFPDTAAVYARFADTIDARGDFDALLLALPQVKDSATFADYTARATAITACTFDESLRMADAIGRAGDRELMDRWLGIAEYLAQDRGALLADLGDVLTRHATDADDDRILAWYQAARAEGSKSAIHRLLNIYSRRNGPDYDPTISAELYVDLVAASAPEDLPATLARLRTATPEIRAIAYRSIDESALYLTAAEAGNATAMREYALLLRQSAQTPAEVLDSTDWLRRAAEAGEPTAMLDYAEALVFGIGVAASRDQAVTWLEKAADLGSAEAAQRLRTLQLTTEVGQ